MHGLLPSRNNVIGFSLNSQPFWHWKSENNRRVSSTLKMGISCDTGILSALYLTLFACFRSCVTGVYEINLYKMPDAGSPGKIYIYIFLSVFPVPTLFHCRYAKEMPASVGQLSGLCPWGGNPG